MSYEKEGGSSYSPVRVARQTRSEDALARIAQAVIGLLASEGQAALTHRRVADLAGVSLAATTYYYAGKFEMINDATARLLDAYINAFIRAAERHREGRLGIETLPALVVKLLKNAAGRHGRDTLAWFEIMLDCARHPKGHAIARGWLEAMDTAWTELAAELGHPPGSLKIGPAVDVVMGLLFITVPLGLSADEMEALMERNERLSPRAGDMVQGEVARLPGDLTRVTNKSRETRDRIVEAALELLMEGDAPLSYSAIAARVGLTVPTTTYHFGTLSALQTAAQRRLMGQAAAHYQHVRERIGSVAHEPAAIADIMADIFEAETTEGARLALAAFAIWVDAARKPELRPEVADMITRRIDDVRELLGKIGALARPGNALIALAQLLGREIRALSTGGFPDDRIVARQEFLETLLSLQSDSHPLMHQKLA
ncbi:hypothetical protein ASE00_06685 [Sphingomonas sp. Root710]|uniref:TetR/AcrR family transcriptional regulator n=1 Tax=Sphingomonas sp. Root710 TaxID=1736594 RepID=UPI0006FB789D|nr:TetR/AcrR family transcriptional regulator [Sphingomonas sp. Root710]KRB86390.1 hypothetical protein ASE00_06685 [Sphingomonas sp. Root710]